MTISSMSGVGASGVAQSGSKDRKAGGAAFDDMFKQAQTLANGRNKEQDDEAASRAAPETGGGGPLTGLAQRWMQDIFAHTRKSGEVTTEAGNVPQAPGGTAAL